MKQYIVNFNFMNEKGELVNSIFSVVQEYAKRAFISSREELIEYLNPQYEKWNEEYNKKYGSEPLEEGSEKYNHYNKWIMKKSQPYVDKVNRKYKFPKGTGLYLNPDEDGDIQFKTKSLKDGILRCFITLTEKY